MKNCCNHNKRDKVCKRKDGKEFNLPRRFTRKRCLKRLIKGFTMRSSCAPYKKCKRKTKKRRNQKGGNKDFEFVSNILDQFIEMCKIDNRTGNGVSLMALEDYKGKIIDNINKFNVHDLTKLKEEKLDKIGNYKLEANTYRNEMQRTYTLSCLIDLEDFLDRIDGNLEEIATMDYRHYHEGGTKPGKRKERSNMTTIGEETAEKMYGLKKMKSVPDTDITDIPSIVNASKQEPISSLKTPELNGKFMKINPPNFSNIPPRKGGAVFWRNIKPDKKDYKKYKKTCFLLPKQKKYPICDKKTKKMNCKGLLAAHNRAKLSIRRGLKNKTYSYKDITKKARKLAKTKKCSWLK
jgi:hypothetical protein